MRTFITQRLLAHAVTTPNGLSAENVELPPGDHRVTLADVPVLGFPVRTSQNDPSTPPSTMTATSAISAPTIAVMTMST